MHRYRSSDNTWSGFRTSWVACVRRMRSEFRRLGPLPTGQATSLKLKRKFETATKIPGIAADSLLPLYLTGGAFAVYLQVYRRLRGNCAAQKNAHR